MPHDRLWPSWAEAALAYPGDERPGAGSLDEKRGPRSGYPLVGTFSGRTPGHPGPRLRDAPVPVRDRLRLRRVPTSTVAGRSSPGSAHAPSSARTARHEACSPPRASVSAMTSASLDVLARSASSRALTRRTGLAEAGAVRRAASTFRTSVVASSVASLVAADAAPSVDVVAPRAGGSNGLACEIKPYRAALMSPHEIATAPRSSLRDGRRRPNSRRLAMSFAGRLGEGDVHAGSPPRRCGVK